MPQLDTDYLRRLRRALITHLTLAELEMITRQLDIRWSTLPGDRKTTKAYSLTMLLQENGRFAELLTILHQEKGSVDWQGLLDDAVREEALQTYIGRVSELLETYDPGDAHLQTIIKNQTSNILPQLDGEQKGSILRFLHQSGLVEEAGVLDASQVDWAQADLREFDFSGASLVGANLSCANLSKANLSKIDLREANLYRANLGGANLWGANLSQADLREAHLWGADLNKAKLYGADLSGARLSGANLWGADLRQADLAETYFWNANLDEADLRGAKHTTSKQLSLAASMAGTILPSGKRRERAVEK